MGKKLHRTDLIILSELDKDCRTPLSDIAKKMRKSPQYVKYRLEKLKEEKIIQTVSILTDYEPGVFQTCAFIKLKGSNVINERLLLDALFKMSETYRLYFCDGSHNIIAYFLVRDYKRLEQIKKELLSNFENIDLLYYNYVASSRIFVKKYLLDSSEYSSLELKNRKTEFDDFEKIVLEELNRDPFASLFEISEKLKVSYDKIKYLFKKENLYLGSRLILSDAAVKKTILFLDIAGDFEEIRNFLSNHKNIVQFDTLLGKNNFVVYFESFEEDLKRIIKELLYQFKDSIIAHERTDIINTYKYRRTRE